MRIIGGQWKGRRIDPPSKNWPVRPTTDFAREALFNILDNRLEYEHIRALDLFGGTGIHALELVSRGCRDVTYVDRYRDSVRFMRGLVKEWSFPIQVVQGDVFKFIRETPLNWDYIFADPPYDLPVLNDFPRTVLQSGILNSKGLFVLEHRSSFSFSVLPGFLEARPYGQSVFSFFTSGS